MKANNLQKNSLIVVLSLLLLFSMVQIASAWSFNDKERQDVNYYVQRAVMHHKHQHYDEAIRYYNKAILIDQHNPNIYYDRGLARSAVDDLAGALADFNFALRLDPSNDSYYFNRGITHFELENYKEALADFNRTLEMVPGDAKALYNRAMTRYNLGDISGALTDARQAYSFYQQLKKPAYATEVKNFIDYVQKQTRQ